MLIFTVDPKTSRSATANGTSRDLSTLLGQFPLGYAGEAGMNPWFQVTIVGESGSNIGAIYQLQHADAFGGPYTGTGVQVSLTAAAPGEWADTLLQVTAGSLKQYVRAALVTLTGTTPAVSCQCRLQWPDED